MEQSHTAVYPPANQIERLQQAINRVYRERCLVTAAQAARLCSMSRNTFNQTFTATMGISFARFALGYRLHGAATQLRQGHDSIKQVAAAWGFTDASHLYHCFQRHFGCAPTDYRFTSSRP